MLNITKIPEFNWVMIKRQLSKNFKEIETK